MAAAWQPREPAAPHEGHALGESSSAGEIIKTNELSMLTLWVLRTVANAMILHSFTCYYHC